MISKHELCKEVERVAGREICTPRDFDWLSGLIYGRTHELVSASTLKRLWGYLDSNIKPRLFTLNVLSQFVGYHDYEAFTMRSGLPESNLVMSRKVSDSSLFIGQQLKLMWQPDRVCLIEYQGSGNFIIIEAENTKLSVGDTFVCHLIIEHEPLYVDQLRHNGNEPTAYVAGRDNGVTFEYV